MSCRRREAAAAGVPRRGAVDRSTCTATSTVAPAATLTVRVQTSSQVSLARTASGARSGSPRAMSEIALSATAPVTTTPSAKFEDEVIVQEPSVATTAPRSEKFAFSAVIAPSAISTAWLCRRADGAPKRTYRSRSSLVVDHPAPDRRDRARRGHDDHGAGAGEDAGRTSRLSTEKIADLGARRGRRT